MADVKRYDLKQEGDYSQTEGVMTEVSNGDWVSADDYDTLAEELKRLKEIITEASADLKEALSDLDEA
jgi:hypothetical protein